MTLFFLPLFLVHFSDPLALPSANLSSIRAKRGPLCSSCCGPTLSSRVSHADVIGPWQSVPRAPALSRSAEFLRSPRRAGHVQPYPGMQHSRPSHNPWHILPLPRRCPQGTAGDCCALAPLAFYASYGHRPRALSALVPLSESSGPPCHLWCLTEKRAQA